jgi:hypothetical protein
VNRFYFFVDTINDDLATLLTENGSEPITVPISALPGCVSEGDWLLASFEQDSAKKKGAWEEIEKRMDELGDNP